jgi:hypothetical protein
MPRKSKRESSEQRARRWNRKSEKEQSRLSNEEQAARLRQVNATLAARTSIAPRRAEEHPKVEEVLPFYVADEQRTRNVHKIYPAAWSHLQQRDSCRAVYELLRGDDPPALPDGIGRLAARAGPQRHAEVLWQQFQHPARSNRSERAEIRSSPAHVQAMWSSPAATVVHRGGEAQTERRVLFEDQVELQAKPIHLLAWLERSGMGKRAPQLRIQVTPHRRLAGSLSARLRWNGKLKQTELRAHQFLFENLPPPDLATAARAPFSVTIQARPKANK